MPRPISHQLERFEAERSPISASTPTAAIRVIPRIACRAATPRRATTRRTALAYGLFQTLDALAFLAYPLKYLVEWMRCSRLSIFCRHHPIHVGWPPVVLPG